jgi:hypothetical protein
MLMRGHHSWLSMNPLSLLKLFGCNHISVASFTNLSMYPILLVSMVASPKLILWPVSKQCFFGW